MKPTQHVIGNRGEIPHIKIGKRILVLRKPWRKMLEGSE